MSIDDQTVQATVLRHNQELRALSQIGTALSTLTDRDTTLRRIFELLGEVMDNRNFYIAVYDAAGDSIYFPIYTIQGELQEAGGRPFGNGITEYVIRTRQPLLITKDSAGRLARLGISAIGTPSASILAVPMLAGQAVVGVMAVQDYTREHAYGTHEQELLETVASQAAVALTNADLYAAAQQELAERKRTEDALRASEARYRAVTELTSDYAYAYRFEAAGMPVLDWVTDAYHRITGYQPGEVEALARWQNLIEPADMPIVERHRAHIAAGKPHACEYRILTKQGERRWLRDVCHPVWDEAQTRVVGVYGAAQDITDRRGAEEAVREADRRLRETLENTQLLAVVIDIDANITFCNDYLLALTGWPRDALIGKNWYEIFSPPETWPSQLARHRVVMANGQFKTHVEDELVTRTGEHRLIAWTNVRLRSVDGQLIGTSSLGQDITEQRQHAREMEALAMLSAALRTAATRAEMLPILLDQATTLVQASGSALARRGRATEEIVFDLATGQLAPAQGVRYPMADASHTGLVLETGQILATRSLQPGDDPAFARLAPDSLAAVCLPLAAAQQTIGALWVARPADFSTGEVRLLEAVAEMAGNALHRTSLHEQTLRRAEQLAAINALGRTLAETLDLPQIYERLYDAIRQLLPELASASISLVEEDQQQTHIVFAAQAGRAPLPLATAWPVHDQTPAALAIQTRRPVRTSGNGLDPAGAPPYGLIVPMLAKSRVIGLVQVQSLAANRFSQDEAELLSLAANTAAVTLENAQLFAQTERRLRHVQALHDIDRAITSSLDLRVTLSVLLEQTTAQLGVDAAAVLLLNPHLQTLDFAAGRGFRSRAVERSHLRVGEGHSGLAALERQTVHITNWPELGASFERARLLAAEGFVTYLAVPLVAKGEVKGVLDIFHRSPLQPNREWWDFLQTLAAQAAIAIDNTALFDSLQRSNIELSLAYDATIEGWSRALDLRDKETEGHTQRVTRVTELLARGMGSFSDVELMHLRRGALLHDIGKMGIPDRILLKPGTLSEDEWVIMRQHPVYANELLSPVAYLRPALDIPYAHHEKWDGSGYPRGLKGEQIPLAARVFAIVDVWDALRSDRPYRPAWPAARVSQHLREQSGRHFDPHIAEVFLAAEHDLS